MYFLFKIETSGNDPQAAEIILHTMDQSNVFFQNLLNLRVYPNAEKFYKLLSKFWI
jgi:hypothetical protein